MKHILKSTAIRTLYNISVFTMLLILFTLKSNCQSINPFSKIYAGGYPPFVIEKTLPDNSLLDSIFYYTNLPSHVDIKNQFDSLGRIVNSSSIPTLENFQNLSQIRKTEYEYNNTNQISQITKYFKNIPLSRETYKYDDQNRRIEKVEENYNSEREQFEIPKIIKTNYDLNYKLDTIIYYSYFDTTFTDPHIAHIVLYNVFDQIVKDSSDGYLEINKFDEFDRRTKFLFCINDKKILDETYSYSENGKSVTILSLAFSYNQYDELISTDTLNYLFLEYENADGTGTVYESRIKNGTWFRTLKKEVKNSYDNRGNLIRSAEINYRITYENGIEKTGTADTIECNIYRYDDKNRIIYSKAKSDAVNNFYYYKAEPQAKVISFQSDEVISITFNVSLLATHIEFLFNKI